MHVAAVLAFSLLVVGPAQASPQPINENQAIDLVFKAVRQAYPEEPLRCFGLMTEDRSRQAFDTPFVKITSEAVAAIQA